MPLLIFLVVAVVFLIILFEIMFVGPGRSSNRQVVTRVEVLPVAQPVVNSHARHALQVYQILKEQTAAGGRIVVVKPDGRQEAIIINKDWSK